MNWAGLVVFRQREGEGLGGVGHYLRRGARGRSSRWGTLSGGGLVDADRG